MVKSTNKREFRIPSGVDQAVCLINWKKKYSKWDIPAKNTHFILLRNTKNGVKVFCNSVGWTTLNDPAIKEHLKKGKAAAYLLHKNDY
jgi:hypothetical protein